MQRSVIIVAGGKGLRMGTETPKQFLPLLDKPLLMHSISAFYDFDPNIQIILVLPESQQTQWDELCKMYVFKVNHQVVYGGETRFHSVLNGLKQVRENSIVAIHDGVRPLVSQRIIAEAYMVASELGVAFPVIPVVDTLRKRTDSGSIVVNRNEYMLVQTPQVFRSEIIQQAYQQAYSESFTDDISVVEALNKYPVFTIEGEKENIKITTPFDLILAESILKSMIGFGD